MDIQRGVVRAYDSVNHQADVLVYGSMSRVILGVPVSHSIGAELMAVGADCGVVVFSPGDTGVVVCTFTGAPDPWVTSALIKDGEVAVGDLAFDPATQAELDTHEADVDIHHDTPVIYFLSTVTTEVLTDAWAVFSTLSQSVTVPGGKTYNVLVVANVEFGCSAYTNYNFDLLQIYSDAVSKSGVQAYRTNAVNDRASVTVACAFTLAATATVSAKVQRSLARNTENAYRGALTIMAWEAT